MTSLTESRTRRIAAVMLAGGALLAACTDAPPGPDQSVNPLCGNESCAGANTGGSMGLPSLTGGGSDNDSALAGGVAGGATGGAGGAAGVPCAVRKVVQDRCGSCHGATPLGSPMSLVTLANWQAPSSSDRTKKYWEQAKVRINAASNPMPPAAIGMLSAAEKAALNGWLDAGAPASSEACEPPATAGGGMTGGGANGPDTTGLDCYRLLAHAQGNKNAKYKVGAAIDKYMNFGFQAPWQGTVYGVVVKPVIDNAQALHHWLLYREQVADGSVTETIGQHAGGELIHGWAPGGIPMDFRHHGDVGFELPPTTYSVEIHYNSSDPNAQDASGVELCVSRAKPQHVASQSWLGYDQGGVISYATGLCLAPATSWTGTCRPSSQQPIHLLFMTPHLHQTGRHLKAVINGPNGSRTLHDKPFDFAYQVSYETKEVLMPGESITTTCTFSAPNCAGQSTSQEMCYLFTLAYPKQTLVDFGPEGTLMHGEGVCLGQ